LDFEILPGSKYLILGEVVLPQAMDPLYDGVFDAGRCQKVRDSRSMTERIDGISSCWPVVELFSEPLMTYVVLEKRKAIILILISKRKPRF
jgi:hypothetical protein